MKSMEWNYTTALYWYQIAKVLAFIYWLDQKLYTWQIALAFTRPFIRSWPRLENRAYFFPYSIAYSFVVAVHNFFSKWPAYTIVVVLCRKASDRDRKDTKRSRKDYWRHTQHIFKTVSKIADYDFGMRKNALLFKSQRFEYFETFLLKYLFNGYVYCPLLKTNLNMFEMFPSSKKSFTWDSFNSAFV